MPKYKVLTAENLNGEHAQVLIDSIEYEACGYTPDEFFTSEWIGPVCDGEVEIIDDSGYLRSSCYKSES